MSEKKPVSVKDAGPTPRGLGGYCWDKHKSGVHCTQPVGHERQGVDHLHPYTKPPTRWK
jgi:hypothetical protein